MSKKGNISVNTENIFPVIKKWLYSDKDIFLREIVSNACDAISKLNKLVSMGEAEASTENYRVDVALDKDAKTITVTDNGIGMSADEVEKYITQVAFSGAEEFIEKYKQDDDEKNKIIGHFGLGFYSAFMVSDTVEINTLSHKKGSKPVHWSCDGGTEYEIEEGSKAQYGTQVILHIADDSKEFLEESKLYEILNKYCGFMPYEIYFEVFPKKENQEEHPLKPVNDTAPLWTKNPKDCTKEEYIEFYRKVFYDFNEPLFWIHLNVEYPFNLQGILYFPKLKNEMANIEGQIKLFNNQVYVADNIKEVTPEFMMLLKGVIDCPDLPLNVSRSFLQNDGYVKKVSAHITKKVADKLCEIYKNQPDDYKKYWADISPFVKFGCLREEKFYDRVKDVVIFKDINGEYITLKELSERENKQVYYASNEIMQAQYINMFKEQGLNALILDEIIDNHFISFIEMKYPGLKFNRIDSDISEELTNKICEDSEGIIKIFVDALNMPDLKIEVKSLKSKKTPAVMLLSEQSRRMMDMAKIYGNGEMSAMFKEENTLVLNFENKIIQKISKIENDDDRKLFAQHIYDLAAIAQKPLTGDKMTDFINRSSEILEKII